MYNLYIKPILHPYASVILSPLILKGTQTVNDHSLACILGVKLGDEVWVRLDTVEITEILRI